MELLNGIRGALTALGNKSPQQFDDERLAEMYGALMRLETCVANIQKSLPKPRFWAWIKECLENVGGDVMQCLGQIRIILFSVIVLAGVIATGLCYGLLFH